ncbi:hypothetical protein NKH72_22205 [Mesorhizobium sp. M0955]|uniref:hypothetical protein n=1 Tax=Mesorhizobium sp. M0955 TaxID=2957033 RepID=UPI00333B47F5
MATLTGCGTIKARLEQAGIQKGRAAAGVQLAPWPDYCRQTIDHALLNKTDDVRVLLRRERRRLSKANAKIVLCTQYYDKYAGLLTVNQNAKTPPLP